MRLDQSIQSIRPSSLRWNRKPGRQWPELINQQVGLPIPPGLAVSTNQDGRGPGCPPRPDIMQVVTHHHRLVRCGVKPPKQLDNPVRVRLRSCRVAAENRRVMIHRHPKTNRIEGAEGNRTGIARENAHATPRPAVVHQSNGVGLRLKIVRVRPLRTIAPPLRAPQADDVPPRECLRPERFPIRGARAVKVVDGLGQRSVEVRPTYGPTSQAISVTQGILAWSTPYPNQSPLPRPSGRTRCGQSNLKRLFALAEAREQPYSLFALSPSRQCPPGSTREWRRGTTARSRTSPDCSRAERLFCDRARSAGARWPQDAGRPGRQVPVSPPTQRVCP